MKRQLLPILALMACMNIYSQKIVEDKTDEFTKKQIVRTDWETIVKTSSLYLHIQLNKVDETKYIELKFFTNHVASIDKKDDIFFMLENGEIINLKSVNYQISGYGDGAIGLMGSAALGLHISCILSDLDIEKFKNISVTKIRINTSNGYFEDDVKEKKAQLLRKTFELIFK